MGAYSANYIQWILSIAEYAVPEGLKPTSVRASLAVVSFAQNKKLPSHLQWTEILYPLQLRALLKRQVCFCIFGASKKFLFGSQRVQVGLEFRCYSKKVFAREEFRFSPLTEEREPHRTAMTRPSKRKVYLRQISKLGGRPPKHGCRLRCASGRVLSDAQQSPT